MQYKIAGIVVDIVGICPDEVLCALEPYRLPNAQVSDLSISCSVEEHIPALELDEVYGIRHFIEELGRYADSYVSQERSGEKSFSTLTFDGDFRQVGCALTDVEASGGDSLVSRMRVALGDCMQNCLPAFGGITYHASAIAYDGEALLFAAPSGTGKSTQTRLWKESFPGSVTYINDDAPILKAENGICRAYGSPWAGTSGVNNNVSAPVKAIIYVERGTENTVRPLLGREKFLRALRSVRKQYFPVQARRQAEILFAALTDVPVYELRCDISRGAVEAVKSLLF